MITPVRPDTPHHCGAACAGPRTTRTRPNISRNGEGRTSRAIVKPAQSGEEIRVLGRWGARRQFETSGGTSVLNRTSGRRGNWPRDDGDARYAYACSPEGLHPVAQHAVGGRLTCLGGVDYVGPAKMSGTGYRRQLVRADHTVGRRGQSAEGGERPENERSRPYPRRAPEPLQHPIQGTGIEPSSQ